MKKILLGISLLCPMQLMATETDSVYTWGQWANGIQPAAGPAVVAPAAAQQPNVVALTRSIQVAQEQQAGTAQAAADAAAQAAADAAAQAAADAAAQAAADAAAQALADAQAAAAAANTSLISGVGVANNVIVDPNAAPAL